MGTAAQRRRGNTSRNKQYQKARKTKRSAPARDIDQIVFEDMQPVRTEQLTNQPLDEDKPGMGQHYCVPCARYFVSDVVMKNHVKGKEHKKRYKVATTEVPYTIEESLRAAGVSIQKTAPSQIAQAQQVQQNANLGAFAAQI